MPPVEAPIANTVEGLPVWGATTSGRTVRAGGGLAGLLNERACAAARTLWGRSCFNSPTEYGPPGLASTSTAPHCNASSATLLDAWPRELITTTGMG